MIDKEDYSVRLIEKLGCEYDIDDLMNYEDLEALVNNIIEEQIKAYPIIEDYDLFDSELYSTLIKRLGLED